MAKLQEMLQTVIKKTGVANKISPDQSEVGENTGEIPLINRAGEPQRMEGAMGTDASLMQVMLQALLQEMSAHLMDEQKKMLKRL
jgi:hypothetical protein